MVPPSTGQIAVMDRRLCAILYPSPSPSPSPPFPPSSNRSRTWNQRSRVPSDVYIKLNARAQWDLVLSRPPHLLAHPSPILHRLPLSIHLSFLHPLICSPGCSTASRPTACHRSRGEAAHICPRTSSSPASCLWTDGTVKKTRGREDKEV